MGEIMKLFENPLTRLLRSKPVQTVALFEGDRPYTYRELYGQSLSLAQALLSMGLKKGDRAILAAAPGVQLLATLYACMMAGIPVALLDPEMGRENYRHKLAQFKPDLAFVDYRLLLLREHPILRFFYFRLRKKGPYFPWVAHCTIIGTGRWLPVFAKHRHLGALLKQGAEPQPSGFDEQPPQDPLLIIYTSGTVAEPKGVVHTAASVSASFQSLVAMLSGQNHRAMATHLPHFALIGVSAGIPVHIWPYPQSPQAQVAFIEAHQISTLFGPPSDFLPLMEYCRQQSRSLPGCLRHLYFGSAPVRRAFLERLIPLLPVECRVTCLYGMTENLLVAHCDGRQKAGTEVQGDLLGKPFDGVEVRIEPDGEICIRSSQLLQRYLDGTPQTGFFKTGDMGFVDEAGNLVLTGRKKDMIIRRNFNLYPGLYEPTINRIPGVVDCAMVGIWSDALQDEQVVLVLEVSPGFGAKEIGNRLRFGEFSIDAEAQPDLVLFMDLPRSGRQQKVDRKALVELVLDKMKGL